MYPFIEAEKAEQDGNVAMACRLLEVSRAAYYEWSKQVPSSRQLSDIELAERIEAIHKASRRTYGAPRVAKALRREGICVGKKRVARIMAAKGLIGRCKRKWKRTTIADETATEMVDLIKRAFGPGVVELDRVYVGDITYIWSWEGWSYLLVTWNQQVGFNGPSCTHELRGQPHIVECTGGEVAGPRPPRASGGVAPDLVRPRSGAENDRRLCARAG
jgi:transposase InsO family protein